MVSIVMVVRNEERVRREVAEPTRAGLSPRTCSGSWWCLTARRPKPKQFSVIFLATRGARAHESIAARQASALNDAMTVTQGKSWSSPTARQTIEPAAIRLLMENFADPDVDA